MLIFAVFCSLLKVLCLYPIQRAKTPELVPEDTDPIWSRGAQSIRSKSVGLKHWMRNILAGYSGYVGDPRIGPSLLLAALMSFGTIWLVRSQQPARPRQSDQPSESSIEVSSDWFGN